MAAYPAAAHKEVEADVARRNRPRALVVDDVADAADTLAMLLRLWGYGAKVCYGGVAALGVARSYRPHVVLLDVGMPGVDGFRVALGLREMHGSEGTVIIGISGHADPVCRARARATGFDHYLIKPADPVHLRGLLARVVPLDRGGGGAGRLAGLSGNSCRVSGAGSPAKSSSLTSSGAVERHPGKDAEPAVV